MKIRDNTTVTVTITVQSGPSWNVTTLAGATRSKSGSMSMQDIGLILHDLVAPAEWDTHTTLDRISKADEAEEEAAKAKAKAEEDRVESYLAGEA